LYFRNTSTPITKNIFRQIRNKSFKNYKDLRWNAKNIEKVLLILLLLFILLFCLNIYYNYYQQHYLSLLSLLLSFFYLLSTYNSFCIYFKDIDVLICNLYIYIFFFIFFINIYFIFILYSIIIYFLNFFEMYKTINILISYIFN